MATAVGRNKACKTWLLWDLAEHDRRHRGCNSIANKRPSHKQAWHGKAWTPKLPDLLLFIARQ